jgi:hypothetical protein
MVFALGCESRASSRIVIRVIEKVLFAPNDVGRATLNFLFGITSRIRIVFRMRDNSDVVSQRRFQIFKVPFVTRIADFIEPLLRLRD